MHFCSPGLWIEPFPLEAEYIIPWNPIWRRIWQPSPVFLPGEFHGQSSLVGYSLWAPKSWTRLSEYTVHWNPTRWHSRTTECQSYLLKKNSRHEDKDVNFGLKGEWKGRRENTFGLFILCIHNGVAVWDFLWFYLGIHDSPVLEAFLSSSESRALQFFFVLSKQV